MSEVDDHLIETFGPIPGPPEEPVQLELPLEVEGEENETQA